MDERVPERVDDCMAEWITKVGNTGHKQRRRKPGKEGRSLWPWLRPREQIAVRLA